MSLESVEELGYGPDVGTRAEILLHASASRDLITHCLGMTFPL